MIIIENQSYKKITHPNVKRVLVLVQIHQFDLAPMTVLLTCDFVFAEKYFSQNMFQTNIRTNYQGGEGYHSILKFAYFLKNLPHCFHRYLFLCSSTTDGKNVRLTSRILLFVYSSLLHIFQNRCARLCNARYL
jgi:hypothetical protein